ncbi:zinc finger protein 644a [Corythoichthys intestinalis]|uniref:zinc finger protein 644a n=1 Tax=Corythoichthys intestinalis TaxID=161448 RepID=UPI0025A50F5E|nr:zinc finger protein 644a [Corythoichthys intestinalis]XP_061794790.1 zinc finger protein 644-like [Nerophis lumbriciformis]
MAAEMSCLAGVDGDEKDSDADIGVLSLLQEPLKMAEVSTTCNDSFYNASGKQSSILDNLSNADMLSPVGLGNGLSLHEATQAEELNSISMDKDEEKSITQLKTVQEIDPSGIWGFDEESPKNSLNELSTISDLQCDPRREFVHFVWENHNDSFAPEPRKEVQLLNTQRRRKRKMDMVMMVDPLEDQCSDFIQYSSEAFSDKEDHVDDIPPDVKQSRTFPNGTMNVINKVVRRHSHEDNPSRGISSLKGRFALNSHSKEKALRYPCSKCKVVFDKRHHLQRHLKSHEEPAKNANSETLICRECGESFRQSSVLIEHLRLHHEKRSTLPNKLKGWTDSNDTDAKLFCPQCPFGTNCPKAFVQHAQTHAKDKKNFKCDKCNFRTVTWHDLRIHIIQHTKYTVRNQKSPHRADDSDIFSCNVCPYKAFSKSVFQNHLWRRHQLELEEYEAEQFSEKNAQQSEEDYPPHCAPVEDAELTSKIMIKNQVPSKRPSPAQSNDISDLFKSNKLKRGFKSQLTESKLDKSINVLLSRQKHRKTAEQRNSAQESASEHKVASPGLEPLSPNGFTGSSRDAERLPNRSSLPNCIPVKKSPSKRKMSTPYRNMSDQDSCFVSPEPLPAPKWLNQKDLQDCDNKDIFRFKDTDDLRKGVNQENHNMIYTYSRRMSIRGALEASKRLFKKVKSEEPDDANPPIKEECIETEVFQEAFESRQLPLMESLADDMPKLDMDCKNCPYCPAVFQSGVGLSNHVRGHLHRVGLTYTARHILTPEQVAYKDKPKVRQKIASFRKLKKVLQLQPDFEESNTHSCPLCGDAFDNRKGQSNHVRGHLKKIGRAHLSKNKSPLIVLKELMCNKKEYLRAVHILGKRKNNFHYGANHFTPSSFGFSQDNPDSKVRADVKPHMPTLSVSETNSDRKQLQMKVEERNSFTDTTALIGILKKRKCQEDTKPKVAYPSSKYSGTVSSNGEQSSGPKVASSLPIPVPEKGEFNRKVCVHCKATFHSGVSLSNHLRACAKRKRASLLERTEFDCKARRQRLRTSSKKKMLTLTQTPEEMYRLTCRFCDLVFQGPLSVQEDWVKHLQRHIMNTGVPRTGLGMMEVTSPPAADTASCVKTDPETAHPAAS